MIYDRNVLMNFLWREDGKKKISGWWKDCLFEVYMNIDEYQKNNNIKGNLGEIGIHQGRSLIPLINFRRDDLVVAIDIKNTDSVKELIKNCYPNDYNKVIITQKNSLKTNAFKEHTPFRMFYIDGNHTYDFVLNDLHVASEVLSDRGVIFLDDYANKRFQKGVCGAINKFIETNPAYEIGFCTCETLWVTKRKETDAIINMLREKLTHWNESIDPIVNAPLFIHPAGSNLKFNG